VKTKTYIGRDAVIVFNGEKIQSFESSNPLEGMQRIGCGKCGKIFTIYHIEPIESDTEITCSNCIK
jgi:hypothetical protein